MILFAAIEIIVCRDDTSYNFICKYRYLDETKWVVVIAYSMLISAAYYKRSRRCIESTELQIIAVN